MEPDLAADITRALTPRLRASYALTDEEARSLVARARAPSPNRGPFTPRRRYAAASLAAAIIVVAAVAAVVSLNGPPSSESMSPTHPNSGGLVSPPPNGSPFLDGRWLPLGKATQTAVIPLPRPDVPLASDHTAVGVWVGPVARSARRSSQHVEIVYRSGVRIDYTNADAVDLQKIERSIGASTGARLVSIDGRPALLIPAGASGSHGSVLRVFGHLLVTVYGSSEHSVPALRRIAAAIPSPS